VQNVKFIMSFSPFLCCFIFLGFAYFPRHLVRICKHLWEVVVCIIHFSKYTSERFPEAKSLSKIRLSKPELLHADISHLQGTRFEFLLGINFLIESFCDLFFRDLSHILMNRDDSEKRLTAIWTIGVLLLAGLEFFSSPLRQNDSGAHPASYQMGTTALSAGLKPPKCESDHSPPSSLEFV
jgi:hypothetical protein